MSRPADLLLRLGDTTPAWPTAGQISLYAKTDGEFYKLDSNGVETPLSVGGTGGSGTVTSVQASGNSGIVVSGGPITTSGVFSFSLGNITPDSVNSTGTIIGSNLSGINTGDETTATIRTKLGITTLSGSNTGDQTITLTGDVTGSGTGTFPATLATVNADVGTFGSSTQIPVLSVDAKGRVTGITTVSVGGAAYGVSSFNTRTGDIQLTGNDVTAALGYTPYNSSNPAGYTSNTGTVTQVALAGEDGIVVNGSPITTTGTLTLTLSDITPASVAASGTITGSNLSGTNTGDQTITLTGDVTGSGTGSFAATLSDTGVVPGTYGSISTVPQIVIDSKGRITSAVNVGIAEAGLGTVSSVDISGGTTGLIATGGPITTTGTITLGGVLSIAAGGTGATDPEAALNNILPPQSGAAGHYLTTDGINAFWNEVSSMGTVTSVTGATLDGVTVSVSNPTTTPTLSVSLGAITPTSVAATGTVTGSNLSGTNTGDETADTIRTKLGITTLSGSNTGDQTITLTGDVTGSGTGSFAATLSDTGVVAGTYSVATLTVDSKGRVTAISSGSASGTGTVTSVALSSTNNTLQISGSPITSNGTIDVDLANSGVTAGTYSNADITVDSYGRVTNATSGYSTTEIVVLRYSPGGSGTLNVADAIYSQTPGVTATVTDGPNSIVKFAFTGKTHPPKSITFYGQVVSTNIFVIKTPVGLTTTVIAGGGTSAVPDLANGIFSSDNVVTVTCTAANTGSVGAVGVRSFALVEFGF